MGCMVYPLFWVHQPYIPLFSETPKWGPGKLNLRPVTGLDFCAVAVSRGEPSIYNQNPKTLKL